MAMIILWKKKYRLVSKKCLWKGPIRSQVKYFASNFLSSWSFQKKKHKYRNNFPEFTLFTFPKTSRNKSTKNRLTLSRNHSILNYIVRKLRQIRTFTNTREVAAYQIDTPLRLRMIYCSNRTLISTGGMVFVVFTVVYLNLY